MNAKLKNKFNKLFMPDENLKKATKKVISKYEGKVPSFIVNLWKEYGFGNYGYGIIKIINPEDYITYIQLVTKSPNYIPFMMDSLGNLFFCDLNSERIYVFSIENNFLDLCGYNFEHFIERLTSEEFINMYLQKDLFEEVLVSGRELNNNDIIIFNPPAILGGVPTMDSLTTKDANAYYDFLLPILLLSGVNKDNF